MIAESHWRTLKHDYLHRFNRPRVDLIVFILITRVLPDAEHRLSAILSGQSRVHKARWREAFKRQWKRDATKPVDPQKLIADHTNPVDWVCGCKAFLQSRFLTCKHIVHCYEVPDRVLPHCEAQNNTSLLERRGAHSTTGIRARCANARPRTPRAPTSRFGPGVCKRAGL
ncbi:hypothetical protein VTN31DRAFT_4256 [Thermomyces dupontii]|uniref:uncharacterized protein n=1 Tax=Talaromyces thermophilus TaxID=28565 RepID=UPI0037424257